MQSILRNLSVLTLLAVSAQAQLPGERPPRDNPRDLPLSSTLYDAWLVRHLPLEELRDRAVRGFIDVDNARFVQIELEGPRGGQAVSDEFVRRFGGVPSWRYRHLLDARVPLERLVELARALPPGHFARTPIRPETESVMSEGPAVTGSAAWRDGGADGSGKTVAIIDAGFDLLDEAVANGELGSWQATNYTDTGLQETTRHGTACAEVVYDHAPGATYRLYKIGSQSQLGNAVADCIDKGVDVISHSMAYFGDWYFDDEGAAADAMREAADAGILVFTAAGNYGDKHWQGDFSPYSGGSGWHGWVPGDRFLRIKVDAGATLKLYLDWDASAPGTDDLDLFLYDLAGSTALASSTNPFEFSEQLSWKNTSEFEVEVNISVWRDAGSHVNFELFGDDGSHTWEHVVVTGSTGSPSNCTHPNVVTVGAVSHGDYGAPAGTSGIVTPYSSRGPTNGGQTRPHVVAPTEVTSFTYFPKVFGGTSCSAPNAAGLALCLWSSAPGYHRNAIRWLILRHGSTFLDWGTGGFDNHYGHGGVNLIDFAPSTRWLTNEYSNPSGFTSLPANTLAHALSQTPNGGRIVAFPGGDYPTPILLTKPVKLVSRGADALYGD